jgi:hypothetical protein
MSRFDIIVDRHPDKPTAYSFKKTNRVGLVYEYIKKCIEDDVALEASNISFGFRPGSFKTSGKLSNTYNYQIRKNFTCIIYVLPDKKNLYG